MTARGFLKTKYGNKPLGEIVANMTALQVESAMEEYAEMVVKNCTIPVVSNNEVAVCPHCKGKGYKTPDRIHSINCSYCNGTGQTDR